MKRLTVARVGTLMSAAMAAGGVLGATAWIGMTEPPGADVGSLAGFSLVGAVLGFLTAPTMIMVLVDRSWVLGLPIVYGPALGVTGLLSWMADPMLLVGLGAAVIWLGSWLAMVFLPASPPGDYHVHCPGCEYDLTGNVSGRCPECGRPTIAASSVPTWDDDEWRQITPALLFASFAISAVCLVYLMFIISGW